MNREQVVLKLLEIEEKIAVGTWKYRDVQIWPLIKNEIFFTCINKYGNHNKHQKKHGRWLRYLEILLSFFYFFITYVKLKKRQILTVAPNADREDYDGWCVSRYFYPWADSKKSRIHLEQGGILKNKKYRERIISLDRMRDYFKIKEVICSKKYQLQLKDWEQIKIILGDEFKDVLTDIQKNIPRMLFTLRANINLFTFLLKKIQPEEVYMVCYYSSELFALNYVANKMGIPTYDMQHGGLGETHQMYTFRKFPVEGYNILPKYFSLWDNVSLEHLSSWLPENGFHKAILGGYSWLEFWSRQDKLLTEERKIIIYTLQYDYLDSFIIDAIKNTSSEYVWWLRYHPTLLSSSNKIIPSQLANEGILEKVELGKSNSLPLPMILAHSYIHISKFSGSIIEAEILGKTSLIIDKIGFDSYQNYIENGNSIAVKSPTGDKIWEEIERINNA